MADKGKLMTALKDRLADVEPLPGERDFITSDETITRFLKARDWKLDEAEKLLRSTIEWRRSTKPLEVDCRWCREKPGYHAIRHVGFDEMGRPVIYSSFAQAAVHKYTVEDSVAHCTHAVENAQRSMRAGVTSWVLIIDCSGMTIQACNPKLGYGVSQVLSNYYPERLGLVICINHNRMFAGVWKAIKVFLHPNTVSKMHLLRSKKKIRDLFQKHFSDELTEWLVEEIRLNKQRPVAMSQRKFWTKPPAGAHDPRGCPSYVEDYIEPLEMNVKLRNSYQPHPNIRDDAKGLLGNVTISEDAAEESENAAATIQIGGNGSDDEGDLPESDTEIDEEFQIPKDAKPLQM